MGAVRVDQATTGDPIGALSDGWAEGEGLRYWPHAAALVESRTSNPTRAARERRAGDIVHQ
jgi:hypothetical protein